MKKPVFSRSSSAFTLIELMAAMAITSVLVIIIVGLTSVGLNFWKSIRNDVRSAQVSRPALSQLFSDLEGIQIRRGNSYEWLYASRDSNQFAKTMIMGPSGAKISNAAQLLFFTVAPDRFVARDAKNQLVASTQDKEKGDVNLVAYRLVYRDHILDEEATENNQGFPVFALYRNLIPAEVTYAGGAGGSALLGQNDLASVYSSRERLETLGQNFLAENIVEFTIAFEVEYQSGTTENPQLLTRLVPILATKSNSSVDDCTQFRVRGNTLYINGPAGSTQGITSGYIKAIIISMTTLSDEGMTHVDQVRRGRAKSLPAARFFKNFSKNVTQRFPVQAG